MNHPKVLEYQADPSRDFNTLLKMDAGQDQGANLPEVDSFTLEEEARVLQDPAYFEDWLDEMTKIMQVHHLDGLLDITIPRPERNSENAAKWQQLSIQVQVWLSGKMVPYLYNMIGNRGYRIQLADEFIMNARLTFQSFGMETVSKLVNPMMLARRSDFETAAEYVGAVRDHYDVSSLVKMHVKPCIVLSRIFAEVRPEIPEFVDTRTALLNSRGDVWIKLTVQDVKDTCAAMITLLKSPRQPGLGLPHVRNEPPRHFRYKRRKMNPLGSFRCNANLERAQSEVSENLANWKAKIDALLGKDDPPDPEV